MLHGEECSLQLAKSITAVKCLFWTTVQNP